MTRPHRRGVGYAVAGVAVALVAVAAALFAAAGTAVPRQAAPPPGHADSALGSAPVAAVPMPRSEPVRVQVPGIGLDAAVVSGGTAADGSIAEPVDSAHASWFAPGPSPGEAGNAVVLGHVDSARGPAVFFRLGEVRAGDELTVTRADGSRARFVVDRTETIAKTDFPRDRVFVGDGTPRLRLITCGGAFDPGARRYLANVIVSATFVGAAAPRT
ncbi:class F sortase [Nocardia thailandica]